MITRKKISLFLLTAGIIAFLVGIYQFNLTTNSGKLVAEDSSVIQSLHSAHFKGRDLIMCEGLLTLGVCMIGIGSYLAGSLKSRLRTHSLVLDFTEKHPKL